MSTAALGAAVFYILMSDSSRAPGLLVSVRLDVCSAVGPPVFRVCETNDQAGLPTGCDRQTRPSAAATQCSEEALGTLVPALIEAIPSRRCYSLAQPCPL